MMENYLIKIFCKNVTFCDETKIQQSSENLHQSNPQILIFDKIGVMNN